MDASSVAALRRVGDARLDAWLDRIISVLLIAILLTGPLLFGALRDQDFFWIQVLGVMATSVWLVKLWRPGQDASRAPAIFLPPIIWPLAAFCVYAVIRYYTSDVEYLARKEVVRVLYYMMFFALALNHFRNAKVADVAVAVLLVLGMGIAIWALRQYFTHSKMVWHLVRPGYLYRGSGTFMYPNHFAGFAEMLIALGVGYVFLGTWSKWARLFLGYCVLWMMVGTYVSFSRAGWMAAIGALLILMPILLRNRRQQIVSFAMLVVLLCGGLLWELKTHQMSNRVRGVLATEPGSGFHSRRTLWTAAFEMWRDHPVWGGGPGHFDERFRAYRTRHFQFSAGHAHCDYLQLLADWGLAGAALLLPALVMYLWPLSKHWIKTVLDPTALNATATNYFALTCGGFAATLALLAHSLVDYQWHAPGVFLTFIGVVAMLIAQTKVHLVSAVMQVENLRYGRLKICVSVLLLAVMVVQAVEGVKSLRERFWIYKAHRAGSINGRIANLERAFAVDAFNFQTAYWIGENYRMLSFEGEGNYKQLAEKAIEWLDRAARLNRFDPYPHMRKAMCLDWLKRHEEAERAIRKALALDPEHYVVLAIAGWHYYQLEDDTNALRYLVASHERNWNWDANPIARQYLALVRERMQQKGQ